MDPTRTITDPSVAAAFETFPAEARATLLSIRRMIFEVARETPGVGRLEETLKWGQPSYLTPENRSGTTIRLAVAKSGAPGVFTHCQTRVIPEFRSLFPEAFAYDGNRGVLLDAGDAPDDARLRMLVRSALTYRL